MALAWQTAVFALQGMNGKLKDFRTLLRQRSGGRQTVEEQRQVLMMLSEQYGIPLKVH